MKNKSDKVKKPMNKTLKKMMPVIIILAIIGIPTILSFFIGGEGKATGTMPMVEVVEVSANDIVEEMKVTGVVESGDEDLYYSPVNAVVATSNVEIGQVVKKGDLLVTFDLKDLEKNNTQSEISELQSNSEKAATIQSNNKLKAKATEASKEVKSLTSEIDTLKNRLTEKQTALTNEKVSSSQIASQMEKYNVEKVELEAMLKEANDNPSTVTPEQVAELESKLLEIQNELLTLETKGKEINVKILELEAEVNVLPGEIATLSGEIEMQKGIVESGDSALSADQIKALEMSNELVKLSTLEAKELLELGKKGIIAEADGVVAEVEVISGLQVTQGMKLFTIASNQDVSIKIEVSTDDFDKINVGNPVAVMIKDYEYKGEVSHINQITTTTMDGKNVIGATIDILNPDEHIFLGVNAKTTITTAAKDAVLTVPSSTINSSSEGEFVYILKDGRVEKRVVELGIADLTQIEVLDGIEEGELVITDLGTVLTEGMEAEPNIVEEID